MKSIHLVALAALFAASPVNALGTGEDHTARRSIAERQFTSPPVGYVQFCRTNAADCADAGADLQPRELTAAVWQELVRVNESVNAQVAPITDAELFGVPEHWTYPANQGDCEDYVLLKRKRLIDLGWSANSVLITVVRDQYGDGHAVLTVVTSAGDLVLDNQDAEIRFWSDTPYRYLKRQSRSDATRWSSLQDHRTLGDVPVATAAGR